ncbi:protein METABOLIC NETWORK MODULATOR 1 isoform X2 [Euphorbia lathyris]|uniref:protein METABOLIC NETWORK MODULATOR 1 isoform X2 n=1 Tax=Euphorbia lathyris TaxID=212925 RepID=UPI0033138FB1
MSEPNQMINPDASAIVPLKRKRGRPRKHPRPDLDRVGSAHGSRAQNPNHREISHGAPGFAGVNRSNPHQVNPVINASDYMVGQAVHGVIEATFDAGYLLTVRVGNSATTLRGIVFKPGHFVPVNADIDVAPGVQMIRRNQVPLPRENYALVHGNNSRSRERNGTVHAARAANLVPSKGKQVPSVVTESSPGISRGNLVPVVLQPVNLSNGAAGEASSNTTLRVQVAASKGKQALDAADPSNGSTPTNQAQAVETQYMHFQSQHNHQEVPSSIQHKAPVPQGRVETLQESESKGMPFEKLLTDIIKRNQAPLQSTDANTSSAAKLSADDSSTASDDYDDDDDDDDEDTDDDDALSVEPLRAVQPDVRNQPAVGSRQLENYRTGKMTELLQVLQENMTEKPAAQVQNLAADPTPKPNQAI